jgi:hypothetical protein
VVKRFSASGPPEASEDLLSYLHLSVVKDVVKGAVAHILATIEGEWLSLSRCVMKAYLRLRVLNSYVLLKYVLTACFGLLRAESLAQAA